jgi:tetratricopeptide (TPR) repeat protein
MGQRRNPLFTFKGSFLRALLICAAALGTRAAPAADASSAFVTVKEALKAENWDGAVVAGERAVQELPDSSEAHVWLGRAYGQKAMKASIFSQMGLAKKCRASFEKAVALDPRSADARVDLIQYYAIAPGIVGGGMDKARIEVKVLDGLDPALGALMSGYLLAREKKSVEAEAEYRRAISLKPGDAAIHWRFGRFLERSGKKDDAKAELREALKLDPALEGAKKDLERLGG